VPPASSIAAGDASIEWPSQVSAFALSAFASGGAVSPLKARTLNVCDELDC
jgi:hypothetical protein